MHRHLLLSFVALAVSGCTVARPATVDVPKERASQCRSICSDLDMRLGAVVVIMNSAGCVCEPRDEESTSKPPSSSSAAIGGAAIHAAIELSQREQTRQQSQR
ncbi:hypothetical protein [Comamonas sp. JC664]|uniref:hypothetical protein n=1 Tax=Comamonas sp. JC664 TaxID=2801917 RepID=UPI00174A8FC8|nr:hypothetical protein [Comamonas sp. JC664]MBL0692542.1 hypothetical protein [Comamonas sp. JC664]GHG92475.1 hypothetical protein GCM10012319_54030 [Comamonas sp. KCTC 72670]